MGLLRASLACASLLVAAVPAHSGGGAITGGATEWTQLLNNAQLAGISALETQQLATLAQGLAAQLQELETAMLAYRNLVANTDILPDSVLGDIAENFAELRSVYVQAQSISRDASSLDAFLTSDAISDTLFDRQTYSAETFGARVSEWQDAWSGTMETTLRSASLSRSSVETEADLMEVLQDRLGSASGRNEILQVGAEMTASLSRQMLDLRSITAAQAEQTAVGWGRTLMQMDAEAAEEERFRDQLRIEREIVDDIEGRTFDEILGIGQ